MGAVNQSDSDRSQSKAARIHDILFELSLALLVMIVIGSILTGAGWILFILLRGLAWSFAAVPSYVGAVGWIVAIPMIGLAVLETVNRLKPASRDNGPVTQPKRRRSRLFLCTGCAAVMLSGNLCMNIAASRVESHYESRQVQGVDIYKNHDLARLVGQCIRLSILRHANSLPVGDERDALEMVAFIAPEQWHAMTDVSDGAETDPRVIALGDANLTEFIRDSKADALHKAEWSSLLREWRSDANANALTDLTLDNTAATIARDFGITLREALKADFERGGKAWAAMQLDIAQKLLNRTPVSLATTNMEINTALAEIKALLADDAVELPTLHRTILDVRQSQDEHALSVIAGFDRIEAALQRIDSGLLMVRDEVASVKVDTTLILDGVHKSAKDIKDVKSLMEALRVSSADWKATETEPLSPIDAQSIESDYQDYLSIRLIGSSHPYFKAKAPLRYRAWLRGAESGNAMAQVLVGRSLELGTGVQQSAPEALSWYERAADQSNPAGLFMLGWMHESGTGGIPVSLGNATKLYEAAAELGDSAAMTQLAWIYRWGWADTPVDKQLALTWLNRAIEQGATFAMCDAADMYSSGELGEDSDTALSDELYERAAEAGNQVAKGVLAGRVVGAAFADYVSSGATSELKEESLQHARSSFAALDALDARALVRLLANEKLKPSLDALKAVDASDPMKQIHQRVVNLLIERFMNADLLTRKDLLNGFANATADTIVRRSSAGEHQDVVELWKKCLSDISMAPLTDGERNELVRVLAACISSLYAIGYRDDATKLADDTYQMTEAILRERPWDWYVRQASLGIGWNAGASLVEQGEPMRAQHYLRKSWHMAFWMTSREDLIDKYPILPLKGEIPTGATPEDYEFFESFAPRSISQDQRLGQGDVKPRKSTIKRFTVPVTFNGIEYPIHIYVLAGKNGYKQVQDQLIWVKEYRGGVVSSIHEESFRKINKMAIENGVDFMELCVNEFANMVEQTHSSNDSSPK